MKEIVRLFRRYFIYIGLISTAINLLMLTPIVFMYNVLDKVIHSRSNMTLIVLLAAALYAVFIMGFLDNLQSRLYRRLATTFKKHLASRVLEINLRNIHQSELAQHGLDDVTELESFLTGSAIRAFFEAPWIPIFLLVLYLFHPLLAATALVLTALLLLLSVMGDKLTAAHEKRAVELSRRASRFAFVARQNVELISSLGMQSAIAERWNRLNDDYLEHSGRSARVSALTQGATKVVRVGGQMLGLSVGAFLILNQPDLTTGVMVASMIIMGRAMSPIANLIGAWKSFIKARSAYARISKLLAEIDDQTVSTVTLPRPLGDVFVDRLFYHLSSDQRILSGVHFKLLAGESLGVIGPSGSGKTTLARLIVGLYKPSQGYVRLDGADVFQWAQNDLGQYIGYLSQEVVLFAGTVAENIARMKDPEIHTHEIIAAAKKARVHDLILKLPKGYDTEVGEGGNKLSGGQRQLIGLARALFGNPSLLVLDEPNANLDGAAEAALIELIRELKAIKATLVIITHKPSVVRDVDHLLVLRRGEQSLFGKNEDVLRELNVASVQMIPVRNAPEALPSKTEQRQVTAEDST